MAKQINRKYHLFDAQGKILGRLATDVSIALSGKNKVDFTPHIDAGDAVVVINTDGLQVTGNKREGKIYHHFSGYPGGIRSIMWKDQMKKDSRKVLYQAVYGMLPKNKHRALRLGRLYLYRGSDHPHKTIHVTHK